MAELLETLGPQSPAWPILIAGVLCAFIPSHAVRKALMLAGPLIAGAMWFATPADGLYGAFSAGGMEFITYRFDPLAKVWGLILIIAAFLNGTYALHERNQTSDAAALIYAGSGIGAVFAGDLLTLFMFWELTALSSVFLIWGARTPITLNAGLRYLAIQVLSGVLLLAGAVMWASETGSWTFDGELSIETTAGVLILIAFGIKAGFPLLHMWIQDAYPKATITGAVVLSVFTTKLAIYALARGYAGTEILVWIGAAMAVFPLFFAFLETDLRRTLAYALNNQLGFMVCAVGVGAERALNGAAAHAFAHILYDALIFMALGAVLLRAGTVRASALGGLYRTMPITALFCLFGAAAFASVPLFSGFVAKALTTSAVEYAGYEAAYWMLLFASAGVAYIVGIKIPYLAFFAKPADPAPAPDLQGAKEAPVNMLIAMGIAAAACLYLGIDYGRLYSLLPFEEAYAPYSVDKILQQLQLLFAAAAGFALLSRFKRHPAERDRTILDVDWVYRKAGDGLARWGAAMGQRLAGFIDRRLATSLARGGRSLFNLFSPAGDLSKAFPSGLMAFWTAALLALVLLVAYFSPALR